MAKNYRVALSDEDLSRIRDVCDRYAITQKLAYIKEHGGHPYLVGGVVRDILMNKSVHDVDVEVHNLSLEQLEKVLGHFGHVIYVGKSFGVLQLERSQTKYAPVDWSIPRRDSSGRKPRVYVDPSLDIVDALKRRDLTINAMAFDIVSHELVDPFNGKEAIKKKQLRTPDATFFVQDPLRFYRVVQFIGRFEFLPDAELEKVCAHMDIIGVSRERIEKEFKKLLLFSKKPSLGLRWLAKIGRLQEILPELAVLLSTEQNPKWHPEGNVFEHTMQVIDAAAALKMPTEREKLVIMYAALCHDLGKAVTTRFERGALRSTGHAQAGVELTRSLMHRICTDKKIIKTVCLLVKYHMEPGGYISNNAGQGAYKKLAVRLAPYANLYTLSQLACADKQGRQGDSHEPFVVVPENITEFIERARKAGVLYSPEKPLLTGKDFLGLVEAGPKLGEVVRKAYALQIKHGIQDKKRLIEMALH